MILSGVCGLVPPVPRDGASQTTTLGPCERLTGCGAGSALPNGARSSVLLREPAGQDDALLLRESVVGAQQQPVRPRSGQLAQAALGFGRRPPWLRRRANRGRRIDHARNLRRRFAGAAGSA
jgi:hypothetical protein